MGSSSTHNGCSKLSHSKKALCSACTFRAFSLGSIFSLFGIPCLTRCCLASCRSTPLLAQETAALLCTLKVDMFVHGSGGSWHWGGVSCFGLPVPVELHPRAEDLGEDALNLKGRCSGSSIALDHLQEHSRRSSAIYQHGVVMHGPFSPRNLEPNEVSRMASSPEWNRYTSRFVRLNANEVWGGMFQLPQIRQPIHAEYNWRKMDRSLETIESEFESHECGCHV